MTALTIPPLLPSVDAILILDGEGNRLAAKYYNGFLSTDSTTAKDIQSVFERQLFQKIGFVTANADSAEVVTVHNKSAVFVGGGMLAPAVPNQMGGGGGMAPSSIGGDVRVVVIGPEGESELVLANFCENLFQALSSLMGGQTDRGMVLDNLELVLLLIDEHCDGGIVLENDPHKLVNSVLLREEDPNAGMGEDVMGAGAGYGAQSQGHGSGMRGLNQGEMTIAQAFMQAKEQIMTNLAQRDGF